MRKLFTKIAKENIIKSSKQTETQVLSLIRPEQIKKWDEKSVKQILAWKTGKTGKINHKKHKKKKI